VMLAQPRCACVAEGRGAGFDGLIGGSRHFNATAKAVSRRVFKACEESLKSSVPKGKVR
jgi:hypothetical protein